MKAGPLVACLVCVVWCVLLGSRPCLLLGTQLTDSSRLSAARWAEFGCFLSGCLDSVQPRTAAFHSFTHDFRFVNVPKFETRCQKSEWIKSRFTPQIVGRLRLNPDVMCRCTFEDV